MEDLRNNYKKFILDHEFHELKAIKRQLLDDVD